MGADRDLDLGVLFEIARANERVAALLRAVLAPTRLTPSGYAVTSVLYTVTTATPTELAQTLAMRPSTLTAHLGTLTDAGLVRRTPGTDGRSVDLTLTPAGRTEHQAAARRVRQVWRSTAAAEGLDLESVRELLARVGVVLEIATAAAAASGHSAVTS